jgi:hypothetical protein
MAIGVSRVVRVRQVVETVGTNCIGMPGWMRREKRIDLFLGDGMGWYARQEVRLRRRKVK